MNPNSVEDKIQRPSVNVFVLERSRVSKGASERARETETSATLCFAVCGEIILREEFLWRDLGEILFFLYSFLTGSQRRNFSGEFLVEGFEYRICFFGEGRLLWRRRGLRRGFVRGRGNFCCFCCDGGLGRWSCGFLCCSGSGGW